MTFALLAIMLFIFVLRIVARKVFRPQTSDDQ
jgi:hypothetical protein